jgi:hypothetical protein
MSGAASPYGAGVYKPPRARQRRGRPKLMARAAAWQPEPLSADDLPMRRTDHGPFVDARGKPLRLAADPVGLTVVGGRRDVRWANVTRFVCRAYQSSRTGRSTRYSVIAGRKAVSWDVPDNADEQMRRGHDQLCRLVASRTGLLLMEEGVAAPVWPVDVRSGQVVAMPVEADGAPGRLHASGSPSEPQAPVARPRRGVWRRLGLLVLLIVLAGAVAYGGTTLYTRYRAQSTLPSSLAGAVLGSSTTYYDALNLSDGDWPAGVLAGSGATAAFRNQAYALDAAGQPAAALMPGAYGADALNVTVGSMKGPGAAGLALRASSDGSALLVYAVGPGERWMLARVDASGAAGASVRTLGGGTSGAIGLGATAGNTLLLIPQGTGYYCYVNGHYVGSVTLPASATAGLPATGGAGVWVAAGTSATFRGFAVYPRP